MNAFMTIRERERTANIGIGFFGDIEIAQLAAWQIRSCFGIFTWNPALSVPSQQALEKESRNTENI